MRKVAGAYTTYFNKKYKREGPLFRGVYKATEIEHTPHLVHISAIIHRVPEKYYDWQHSSLNYYIGDWKSDWVVPDKVYRLYDWGAYESILNDHSMIEEKKRELEGLLANT